MTALLLFAAGCGGVGSGGTLSSSPPPGWVPNPGGQVTSGSNLVGGTVVAYQAGATPGADAIQLGSATTDNHGRFGIALDPTPADGAIVYFVMTGGDAGSGTNSAISEIVVWGRYCPGCDLPSSVKIDEVTTVATASALQRYITFVPCSIITGNTQSGTYVGHSRQLRSYGPSGGRERAG